jgi:hypothetical protein
MRALIAVMIAGLVVAGGAQSQTLKKATPPDTGAYRGQATALIKTAEATAVFVAGASPSGPLVQHVKSNLVCRFEPNSPANQVKVFDSGANRGDDVGCGTQVRGITATIFAVRGKSDSDVPKSETQTLADFKRQFPDAIDYKGAVAAVTDKTRPSMAIARMASPRQQKFMKAVTFKIGPWVFSQTIIAPLQSAAEADAYSEAQLTLMIKDIRLGRPS